MIRLGGCPSWSESSLGLHAILLVLSRSGSYHATFCSNTLLPYLYKKLIYIFAFISFIIVVLANIHVVSLYLSMVQYCSRHYWTVKLLMFLELRGFTRILRPSAVARSEACPLGIQAAPSSIPTSGTFFHGDLVMKKFLRPFSLFRWFKKSSCQLLAEKCALSTGKLPRRLAQEQCGLWLR